MIFNKYYDSIYIVKNSAPTILEKYSGGSLEYSYDFGAEISFIDSVNDILYVHSAGVLYYGNFYSTPDNFSLCSLSYSPATFLSNYSFISTGGNYVIFSGGETLMKSNKIIPDKSCTFLNSKQPFYAANGKIYGLYSGATVYVGSTWLDSFYQYNVTGKVIGVNSNGILKSESGKLVFAEHQKEEVPESSAVPSESTAPSPTPGASIAPSSKPQTTPTPSASLEPTPSVSPNPKEELTIKDHIVYLDCGDKVSRITKTYGLEVYKSDGSKASGDVRTGMYFLFDNEEYLICVTGDINGSGTVNSSDIKALQKHVINETQLDGIYKTAADMNDDGSLNTVDLYLLAKLISKN